MKFRFVQEHRETFRVGLMCKVLKVSRSGYYAWRERQPSPREREDRELAGRIHAIHRESRETYGSPRIQSRVTEPVGLQRAFERLRRCTFPRCR